MGPPLIPHFLLLASKLPAKGRNNIAKYIYRSRGVPSELMSICTCNTRTNCQGSDMGSSSDGKTVLLVHLKDSYWYYDVAPTQYVIYGHPVLIHPPPSGMVVNDAGGTGRIRMDLDGG